MGKKRKGGQIDEERPEYWCYYCDQTMANEDAVISHQINKHFRCPECPPNIPPYKSAMGLLSHYRKTHGPVLEKIPNSIPGRGDPGMDVRGMSGIPEELLTNHPLALGTEAPLGAGLMFTPAYIPPAYIPEVSSSLMLDQLKKAAWSEVAKKQNTPDELKKRAAEYAAKNHVPVAMPDALRKYAADYAARNPVPRVPSLPITSKAAPQQPVLQEQPQAELVSASASTSASPAAEFSAAVEAALAVAQQSAAAIVVKPSGPSPAAAAAASAAAAAFAAVAQASAVTLAVKVVKKLATKNSQGSGVSSADVSRLKDKQARLMEAQIKLLSDSASTLPSLAAPAAAPAAVAAAAGESLVSAATLGVKRLVSSLTRRSVSEEEEVVSEERRRSLSRKSPQERSRRRSLSRKSVQERPRRRSLSRKSVPRGNGGGASRRKRTTKRSVSRRSVSAEEEAMSEEPSRRRRLSRRSPHGKEAYRKVISEEPSRKRSPRSRGASKRTGVGSGDISRSKVQQSRRKDIDHNDDDPAPPQRRRRRQRSPSPSLDRRRERVDPVVTVTLREQSDVDEDCILDYLEAFGDVHPEGLFVAEGSFGLIFVWKCRFADDASAAKVRSLPNHLVPNVMGKEVKVEIS